MQQGLLGSVPAPRQLQVRLAGGINPHPLKWRGHPQPFDVGHILAKLEVQILKYRPRGADGGCELRAPVAVQRMHLEVLRERMLRLVEKKKIALANLGALR
jgi:hypothetical protein